MSEPKYAIGDTLRHVAEPGCKLFVVAVLSEQCPGGTQHHYHCRLILRGNPQRSLEKFNEIELTDQDDTTLRELVSNVKDMAVNLREFDFAQAVRDAEKKILEKNDG